MWWWKWSEGRPFGAGVRWFLFGYEQPNPPNAAWSEGAKGFNPEPMVTEAGLTACCAVITHHPAIGAWKVAIKRPDGEVYTNEGTAIDHPWQAFQHVRRELVGIGLFTHPMRVPTPPFGPDTEFDGRVHVPKVRTLDELDITYVSLDSKPGPGTGGRIVKLREDEDTDEVELGHPRRISSAFVDPCHPDVVVLKLVDVGVTPPKPEFWNLDAGEALALADDLVAASTTCDDASIDPGTGEDPSEVVAPLQEAPEGNTAREARHRRRSVARGDDPGDGRFAFPNARNLGPVSFEAVRDEKYGAGETWGEQVERIAGEHSRFDRTTLTHSDWPGRTTAGEDSFLAAWMREGEEKTQRVPWTLVVTDDQGAEIMRADIADMKARIEPSEDADIRTAIAVIANAAKGAEFVEDDVLDTGDEGYVANVLDVVRLTIDWHLGIVEDGHGGARTQNPPMDGWSWHVESYTDGDEPLAAGFVTLTAGGEVNPRSAAFELARKAAIKAVGPALERAIWKLLKPRARR